MYGIRSKAFVLYWNVLFVSTVFGHMQCHVEHIIAKVFLKQYTCDYLLIHAIIFYSLVNQAMKIVMATQLIEFLQINGLSHKRDPYWGYKLKMTWYICCAALSLLHVNVDDQKHMINYLHSILHGHSLTSASIFLVVRVQANIRIMVRLPFFLQRPLSWKPQKTRIYKIQYLVFHITLNREGKSLSLSSNFLHTANDHDGKQQRHNLYDRDDYSNYIPN